MVRRTAAPLCLCIHGATWHLYTYKAISPEVASREGTVHHKGGTPGCLARKMEPHPRRLNRHRWAVREACHDIDVSLVACGCPLIIHICLLLQRQCAFSAFTVVNVFDSVLSSSITLARNIPEVSLIGSVDKTVPVVPEERGTWPRLCFPTSWGVPLKAATLEAH